MEARMNNPAMIIPDAMKALQALGASLPGAQVSSQLLELIHLRASQINGCSVCVEGHTRILRANSETEERITAVAAWRDAPYFTDAERAALELTERLTRLDGPGDPVPDDVWQESAQHYDEESLARLILSIANINIWNRLNIATRQVAGAWAP